MYKYKIGTKLLGRGNKKKIGQVECTQLCVCVIINRYNNHRIYSDGCIYIRI